MTNVGTSSRATQSFNTTILSQSISLMIHGNWRALLPAVLDPCFRDLKSLHVMTGCADEIKTPLTSEVARQKSIPADVEEVKPAAKPAKSVAGLGALLHRAVTTAALFRKNLVVRRWRDILLNRQKVSILNH